MLRNVFAKTLRDLSRGFLWWSAGLGGLVALMVSVYPTVRDNPELNRLVQQYPEALKAFISFGGAVDYVSGAGYLGSELFSFMIPLLFLIAAIGNGAGAIAGEEERGTLELLLAHPVGRRRVGAEKLGAMVVEVAGLAAVLWLALWIGASATDLGVSPGHLAAACASAGFLALAFGSLAFMIGAATGHRVLAVGLATAAAAAAYLVNSLAGLVEALRPAQKASPFYHYAASDPLRHGLAADHVLILVAIVAATAAVGLAVFDRRDVAA
jgi:ABC-2 type transport system permease protein